MARIAGINIPQHQHAEIGLTAIFGIGRTRARKICEACDIAYSKKIKDLTDGDLEKIRDQIAVFTIEGDLRRETGTPMSGSTMREPASRYPAARCCPSRGCRAVSRPARSPA